MIVYCCSDLIFATRIGSTADALGLVSRPARDVDKLSDRLNQVDDGKANEPVAAVFIDLDLAEKALALIQCARQHDPGLPIVAFGSHVAKDLLQAAADHGADPVLPRSAFTAQLPALLEQFSRSG